jgi:hypothetical protein
MFVMQNITLEISEDELREVTRAYQILQRFLTKVISPNYLYNAEFLRGLEEAQAEVAEKQLAEVNDFAGFIR